MVPVELIALTGGIPSVLDRPPNRATLLLTQSSVGFVRGSSFVGADPAFLRAIGKTAKMPEFGDSMAGLVVNSCCRP